MNANPLRAGGISSPSNFSTARHVAEIVGHGAEIVDAVGHGHDLLVELGFAGLFDAGVQEADVGHDAHDGFAVDFEQHAQDAVRRGMLRAHVQDHGLVLAGIEHRGWSQVRH
jgi:ATP phosphoribosyltransferase regulatory subunit HisZ